MRLLIKKIFSLTFVILVIILSSNKADACSCESSQTVDKEIVKFANIAVFKLIAIKKLDKTKEPSLADEKYSLTVEKVFKGNLKVGETVTFENGFACIWNFDEKNIGSEFLFYLGEEPKKNESWIAGYCTRSGRLSARTADLLYLEKEKQMRGKTRLSGTLNKMTEIPEKNGDFLFESLPNKQVSITGKGKEINLSTDANGDFEVYDLPPGKYKIVPEKIEGFRFSSFNSEFTEVEIKAKSHTENDFYFEINNAVSGKVLDQNNKPLQYVCLDLIPSKSEKAEGYSKGSCTNKNGEFEIISIPVGNYILAINKDGEPRLSEPFTTFYYPNKTNKVDAAEITIGENCFLKDLQIIPPQMIETLTLSGILTFNDGKPAANETVQFLKGEEISKSYDGYISSDFKMTTDKNGKFTFKTLKGQNGILRGSMYSFVGEYKNCPQIDNLIKEKGDKVQRIDTVDYKIDATKNLSGINLSFPFDACKKE